MKIKTLSAHKHSCDEMSLFDEFNEFEQEVLRSAEESKVIQQEFQRIDYATEIKNIVSSTEAERAHQTIMELNSMGVLKRAGLKIEDTREQADSNTLQQIEIHCEGIISGTINFIKKIIKAIVDSITGFFKWIGRLLGFNPSSGGGGGASRSKIATNSKKASREIAKVTKDVNTSELTKLIPEAEVKLLPAAQT